MIDTTTKAPRLCIAGRWYPLVKVDRLVSNSAGVTGFACAFLNPRRIEISSECAAEFRLDALLQSIAQAWRLELPGLNLAEEQVFSRIAARALLDLQRIGVENI